MRALLERRLRPRSFDILSHPRGETLLAAYPQMREELATAYRKHGGAAIIDAIHALHLERQRAIRFGGYQSQLLANDKFTDAVRAYALHGKMVTNLTNRGGRTGEVFQHLAQLPHDAHALRLVGQAVQLRPESTVRSVRTRDRLRLLARHPEFNRNGELLVRANEPINVLAALKAMRNDALAEKERIINRSPRAAEPMGNFVEKLELAIQAQENLRKMKAGIVALQRQQEESAGKAA